MNHNPLSIGKRAYLFYITFWALLGIFPVFTDYFLQKFSSGWYLFTPHPTEFTGMLIYTGAAAIIAGLILQFTIRKGTTDKLEYLSIGVMRYVLIFIMVIFYGYGKLVTKQFQVNFLSLETPMKDVSSAHLTWYFYGRSNYQTSLYGFLEFLPGMLLLFRRTVICGALLLLPVIINILLINIFNDIEGGHTYTFIAIFLFFDIGILLYYREEIKTFLSSAKSKMKRLFEGKVSNTLITTAKLILIGMILFVFGKGIYIASTEGTELSKVDSKCFGIYELQDISYNSQSQNLDSLNNYWKKLYFEKRDYWNFKLIDKNDQLVYMTYRYYSNPDSLGITVFTGFDEEENPTDSIVFRGQYFLSDDDSIMLLKGMRNDTLLECTYRKLPVDGHDWWW